EGHGHEHGHDGEGEDHHHAFPGAVGTFHDVLSPVWHNDGADRAATFCAATAELEAKAAAMVAEVPEGVDAAAWSERGAALTAAIQTVAATCAQSPSDPP